MGEALRRELPTFVDLEGLHLVDRVEFGLVLANQIDRCATGLIVGVARPLAALGTRLRRAGEPEFHALELRIECEHFLQRRRSRTRQAHDHQRLRDLVARAAGVLREPPLGDQPGREIAHDHLADREGANRVEQRVVGQRREQGLQPRFVVVGAEVVEARLGHGFLEQLRSRRVEGSQVRLTRARRASPRVCSPGGSRSHRRTEERGHPVHVPRCRASFRPRDRGAPPRRAPSPPLRLRRSPG